MSGHRQRVIPKRLWAEGEWYGPATDNPHDPRNDPWEYEQEQELIALEAQFNQQRQQQQQEQNK